MLISSNSVGLPAASVAAQEKSSGMPATAIKMDLLRSLLIVDRLAEMDDTAAADAAAVDTAAADAAAADPIDQALESFWTCVVDDRVHRTGTELAQHNYQRNLRHIEQRGDALMREVQAMPAGPQRAVAQEKLTLFLAEQRTQIEAQYQLDGPKQAGPIFARVHRMAVPTVAAPPPPPAPTP